jgi:hypothetical protein
MFCAEGMYKKWEMLFDVGECLLWSCCMASSPTKFTGWAPKTTTANHVDLALTKFEPKVWDDDDVESE